MDWEENPRLMRREVLSVAVINFIQAILANVVGRSPPRRSARGWLRSIRYELTLLRNSSAARDHQTISSTAS